MSKWHSIGMNGGSQKSIKLCSEREKITVRTLRMRVCITCSQSGRCRLGVLRPTLQLFKMLYLRFPTSTNSVASLLSEFTLSSVFWLRKTYRGLWVPQIGLGEYKEVHKFWSELVHCYLEGQTGSICLKKRV